MEIGVTFQGLGNLAVLFEGGRLFEEEERRGKQKYVSQ